MAPSMFQTARTRECLQLVAKNQVKCIRFDPIKKISLGTEDLNGCTAIVILSKNAAILGHVSPRPPSANINSAAGDAHIIAKMDEVRALLGQHLGDFEQTPGSMEIVAYAFFMGKTALHSQKDIIEARFKEWKTQFKYVQYTVLDEDEERASAKGTVLIGPRDEGISVYVEDEHILSVKRTASSGSSAAESSKAA